MLHTRMGVRSSWIEESDLAPITREGVIEHERAGKKENPRKAAKTTLVQTDDLSKRSAAEPSKPTKPNNNLIPHWSYEKSSLAAGCIFAAIAVVGLIILVILSVRKIRRSWKRHKREKRDYASFKHRLDMTYDDRDSIICVITENQLGRESMMYSHDSSPSVGYVVEQKGGSVTRVYREGNNVPSRTFDSIAAPIAAPPDTGSPTRKSKRAQGGQADTQTPAGKERAGSIPRPIVVVPSPLKHISSLKATPVMPPTGPSTPDSERLPISPASQHGAGPMGRSSNVKSLCRLPSIKKTISPLLSF
ncbi:hypothetical protein BDV28DRAFT_132304 [Aspergillus coremiiformis]|uniref:Uncharacterized protein n=1 Tax=Aspergillus coremiiformis TaxID=138285 RepID=A0A5N6Z837_9EURO|nr:hypothetical protein BDV28DRAFT_132304 [Aspergillus coremiiformis]